MDPIVVLSAVDTPELAQKIANALVEAGEAACVNIVPGIRSIYKWKGMMCDDAELFLVIKSSSAQLEAIRERIVAMHSYEVPEVIALPITKGDSRYLAWLGSMVTPK
jgi:periplasmic divalent cation tolerance protein